VSHQRNLFARPKLLIDEAERRAILRDGELKWVALAAPTEGLKEVLRQLAVLQASSSTETL